ncbi:MAG: helix-turn-helix domain-containing protein [Planctomycetota bacterium]|jgi:transcriptional regulator with XRE-family HTH domain
MGFSDEEVPGLCDALIQLRASGKWTQSEWAKRLGVSQANVAKYEAGGLDFPLRLIPKVARALGQPQDVVFVFLMKDRFDRIRSCDPELAEELSRFVDDLGL